MGHFWKFLVTNILAKVSFCYLLAMWPEWAFLKVLGDKHSCKSSRNTCWPLGLTLRLLKLLYGPQSVTAKVKIFVKTWKVNIESFWCNNLFRSAQNDHRTLIWSSSRLINWIGKKRKRIFQRDWREKNGIGPAEKKYWGSDCRDLPRLHARGRFKPCLGPGYFLLRLSDCMMDTCMLLAVVRVHEHWWPQLTPLGWEWG